MFEITGVDAGRAADLHSRARRYTIGMSIRTVCFVAAVISGGWLRWVFVVGALVLPYVAVLIANAGRESGGRRSDRVLPPVPPVPPRELPAARPATGEAKPEWIVADAPVEPERAPGADPGQHAPRPAA